MSLRTLLSLVVVLALAALAVAALAIADAFEDRDADALARVTANNAAAVKGLARAYERLPADVTTGAREAAEHALRRAAATALEAVAETRGGYCWPDGELVQEDSATMHVDGDRGPRDPGQPPPPPGGPRDRPPMERGFEDHPPGPERPRPPDGLHRSPPPPPAIRAAIRRICASASTTEVTHERLVERGHAAVVSGQRLGAMAAFTTRLLPIYRTTTLLSAPALIALALVTLALVGIALAIMTWLRRGVGDVSRALARLETDLRAEPPAPRTREFGQIFTRLRAMATRLADARDRERELERQVAHEARLSALGRMVAGVAHEVRNPLTGMKLLLEGMRRRGVDARTRDEAEACLREIARLEHVVTSFLGVARDARSPAEPLELGALAAERATAAGALATVRQVEVTTGGRAELTAERDVVVRVLDNLLRNAIEASPASARVEVRVGEDAAGAHATVVDRGAGVPAKVADALFEPFVSSKPDGTGLGLWLSRALIESRGGDLRYDRRGDETHFTLSLPKQAADAHAPSPHDPGRR